MEKRTGTIDWRIRAAEGEPEKRTIYGYAIVYGAIADLGWFTEEVQPGFASEVLAASDLDVRALFNHNVNHVLARKRNSDKDTLQLKEDATGLYYEFEAPNTTTGNDLLENIRLGNVSQSSFGFDVKDSSWQSRVYRMGATGIIGAKSVFDQPIEVAVRKNEKGSYLVRPKFRVTGVKE